MNTIKDTGDTAKSWEGRFTITQDSANTYEIRFNGHVKGGIFAHDLPKFLKDFIRTLLKEQREETIKKIRQSSMWKLVPNTPRMIMCKYSELDDLLKELNN